MKRCTALCLTIIMLFSLLCGCGTTGTAADGLGNGWEPARSMELQFATQFAVDHYAGGYKLISLADGSRFLVIPEGSELPQGIAKDIVPLYQPLENIYIAATASICLFDALDSLDRIRLSGTKEEGWHIENAKLAMQQGRILYAGKYSEPDYEMLLEHRCPLAVESLMIGHASEVKDKLEELGIAVFIDRSSSEPHPLGRTEWIRLYGALLNQEDKADALFQQQVDYLNDALNGESSGKTVAFFHISSSGHVVARKSGDYVSNMIDLAGGKYVFEDLGDPEKATSTVTLEMETFFAEAKDADVIIYNSAIVGEVESIEELIEINGLLAEFKAVQNGNVWCTSQNMYQETTELGLMIQSFQKIFSGEADDLDEVPYLNRLQ